MNASDPRTAIRPPMTFELAVLQNGVWTKTTHQTTNAAHAAWLDVPIGTFAKLALDDGKGNRFVVLQGSGPRQ